VIISQVASEKLVTLLLVMAANKYQECSNARSLTRFANIVQNVFNTKILGFFTHQSQWKLPMSVRDKPSLKSVI
jgi:hypothetical protein